MTNAAPIDRLDLADQLGQPVATIPAMLAARTALTPESPAQWEQDASGDWRSRTWKDFEQRANDAAARMIGMGLRPGDRVGIIAPSSPDWDVAQFGILAAGGVVVGLDPHDVGERTREIIARCQIVGLAAGGAATVEALGDGGRSALRFVVSLAPTQSPGLPCLADRGSVDVNAPGSLPPVDPDAPATIIFTSGTTGAAKGIVYTHRQIVMATASILRTFADIEPGSRMACWLPLSNLFQRMLNFCAIARGAQIYYVPQPQEIMRHVAAIRPEVFIGVPRFYEKLYAGIVDQIDGMPGPRRRAALWCLRVGSRYRNDLRSARGAGIALRLTYALADRLVLRHIRGVMGTNLRYMISGSAPMPRWLLERFEAIGWRVFEAYGLSENVIPVAANSPAAHRLGTVGQVMPGNEVRLAGDGELWVRGPGVCTGYLGDEAASPPADVEGFLATGDYATIDADRFVTLTGRKSDIFKTSTGRRIAPAAVEAALRAIPYVEHAVLFGSGRPFAVAILAVSGGRLRGSTTVGGVSSLVDSRDAIVADVRRVLAAFPDYQRPSGLLVTTRAFGIDSGELTANLKLRRQGIAERFASALDELYALLEASKGASAMRVVEDGTTLLCNV